MLHPDESQLEIENHSLVEAQLSSGRYRWLDLVARRWAILLEDTLYSESVSYTHLTLPTICSV